MTDNRNDARIDLSGIPMTDKDNAQGFEEWLAFRAQRAGLARIPWANEYHAKAAWENRTAHYQKELAAKDKLYSHELSCGKTMRDLSLKQQARIAELEGMNKTEYVMKISRALERETEKCEALEAQQQWIPISTLPTYTKDTTCIVETSGGVFTDDWEPEWQEFEQMHKSVVRWMPLPPK